MTQQSVADAPAEGSEVLAPLELDRETRGLIAEQVGTAKRYPRSVKKFLNEAQTLVTLDEDTASHCMYALPRGGKTIEGPSARFAEILASTWGNLRIDARIVADDGRMITARGTAWDLERNVLIGYEVQRRVTDKSGKRFVDDMIVVTGNAASSIALRNAVLKVIPAAFWKPLYLKAKEVAVGTTETLVAKRTKMLQYFQKLGAPTDKVFAVLGVAGESEITLDHVAALRGLATAIKEGDTTLDEAFAGEPGAGIRQPERKAASVTNGAPAAITPAAATDPPRPAAAAHAAQPRPVYQAGQTCRIAEVTQPPGKTYWYIETDARALTHTYEADVAKNAQAAKELGTTVRFTGEAIEKFPTAPFRIDALEVVDEQ